MYLANDVDDSPTRFLTYETCNQSPPRSAADCTGERQRTQVRRRFLKGRLQSLVDELMGPHRGDAQGLSDIEKGPPLKPILHRLSAFLRNGDRPGGEPAAALPASMSISWHLARHVFSECRR